MGFAFFMLCHRYTNQEVKGDRWALPFLCCATGTLLWFNEAPQPMSPCSINRNYPGPLEAQAPHTFLAKIAVFFMEG